MTTPTYRVVVYFGTSTTGAGTFTLDDPTSGLLDSATYLLGGDTGTDLSNDAISIQVQRGRPSQLFSAFQAGTATIQLNNEARTYDPLYSGSPYAGNLTRGKRVTILANGIPFFDGRISDWQLNYDRNGRSVATIQCEDALATLARKQFAAWTATAGQTGNARFTDILNRPEVGWSGGARNLSTGVSILQGDTVPANTNVLNYAQLVARSDAGVFFASRDGLLTFKDRASLATAPAVVQFDDIGVNTPFTSVAVTSGSDTFFTRVQVTRAGGTTQAYQTATATTDDIVSLSIEGLLQNSDSQALEMASYLANIYSAGDARISQVGTMVDTQTLTATEITQLLTLELADLVAFTWTPNKVGTAINQNAIVDGIRHDIFPGRHQITLTLGKSDQRGPFILDSATNGILDGTTVLVF